MKILLTGAKGQLGQSLQQCVPQDIELIALDHHQLDITDAAQVLDCIAQHQPDSIINAAAYTAVDLAEKQSAQAFSVNAEGAKHLALAAEKQHSRLIHVSTDYVFDGQHHLPYLPSATTNPLSVYGKSKWAGEQFVQDVLVDKAVVIRTGWLYSAFGHNFFNTMLRLMAEKKSLNVVADQIGTPTWAHHLALAIWAMVAQPTLSGTYHFSDAGVASWYDFACAIGEHAVAEGRLKHKIPITPISTSEYPTPAPRPAYAVLDKSAIWRDLAMTPVHWTAALHTLLRTL
jgi:dTDP-4-dehydrorhamnose reductase